MLGSNKADSFFIKCFEAGLWLTRAFQRYLWVNEVFSEGFPASQADLSETQELCLYQIGAAEVLYHLGKIKTLFPAENTTTLLKIKEVSEIRNSQIFVPEEFHHLVFEERETDAFIQILKEVEALDFPSTVILIYGHRHDFEAYETKGLEIEIPKL